MELLSFLSSTFFNLLIISASLLYLLTSYFLRFKLKPWCKCETCQSFLSANWTSKFDNLPDWISHLLRFSPTQTIHIHILNNTITANPENVEHILKTNFENYPKGSPFAAILGDLLGRGIFVADGETWRFQRKIASMELGSVSIRAYAYEILASEIRTRLIPLLSNSAESGVIVDLQDVFRRFSFDNICQFSFGIDPGYLQLSLPMSEFTDAFDVASKLSAERALTAAPWVWKLKRLLNWGSERKLKEAIGKINFLAEDIIEKRKKMGFSMRKDLLSRFMSSTIDDDKYLRDIVISFLLAGRDTVASALTVVFYLLSKNPGIKSKIREESDRIFGDCGDDQVFPRFEQLKELHYLHAALYECLRLFPPIQIDSKYAKEDDILPDGTLVKMGTKVSYHPYAMGRMERIWGPDCLRFKPERWLRDGVFQPENPYKYPVFQAGVRACLGKEIALVIMKTVVISLIRKFDFLLAEPNRQLIFVPGLTATLRGGLPVLVKN
ncbi:hypothetical protein Nepgr_000301 [Nepenthes gracilis]|uniref:Cytochrome P450 n=1 Tax=Nepenthes gracilis TaxID=150966 RepID=A0AAD3P6A2_NEPGR|nr:hypothetical protein Nepgr_000301 [Nepenthes gracilis]